MVIFRQLFDKACVSKKRTVGTALIILARFIAFKASIFCGFMFSYWLIGRTVEPRVPIREPKLIVLYFHSFAYLSQEEDLLRRRPNYATTIAPLVRVASESGVVLNTKANLSLTTPQANMPAAGPRKMTQLRTPGMTRRRKSKN